MAELTIELIPIQSWKLSLANLMPQSDWKKIRESCYARANWRCEICRGIGVRHKVECHEIWEFSYTERTQLLTGFIALCPDCHSVKHIGRTFSLGESSRKKAIHHLMKINEWTILEAQNHIDEAIDLWIKRSFIAWNIDTSLAGFSLEQNQNQNQNQNQPEHCITWYGDVPDDRITWKLQQDSFHLSPRGISIWKKRLPAEQAVEKTKPKVDFKDLFY